MTTTRNVARAVVVTSASAPQWRVELEAGTDHLVADQPTTVSGRTPVTTMIRAGAPITTSIRAIETPTPSPTS